MQKRERIEQTSRNTKETKAAANQKQFFSRQQPLTVSDTVNRYDLLEYSLRLSPEGVGKPMTAVWWIEELDKKKAVSLLPVQLSGRRVQVVPHVTILFMEW